MISAASMVTTTISGPNEVGFFGFEHKLQKYFEFTNYRLYD